MWILKVPSPIDTIVVLQYHVGGRVPEKPYFENIIKEIDK